MMAEQQKAATDIQARFRGNRARRDGARKGKIQVLARTTSEATETNPQKRRRRSAGMAPSAELVAKQKRVATLAVGKLISAARRLGMSLTELLQTIDGDGSGEIDVAEFRAGMLALRVTFTDEEITALMEQLDTVSQTSQTLPLLAISGSSPQIPSTIYSQGRV